MGFKYVVFVCCCCCFIIVPRENLKQKCHLNSLGFQDVFSDNKTACHLKLKATVEFWETFRVGHGITI